MAAVFTCPPGSICPPPATDKVGPNNTNISYISSTTVTQGSDGKVNGSERVLYIVKNDTYQPAAISKDGGKTYTFSDPKYPLMAGVAGADLQNDLNKPTSAIHKNADAGIAKVLPKEGIKPTEQQSVVASTANQATDAGADGAATGSSGGLTKEQAEKLKADLGKEKSGTRNEFPGARGSNPLVYPITLRQDFQDVIKFSMIKYAPRALDAKNEGKDLSPFEERRAITLANTIGTVILPIPNGITDTNSCDWGSNTTGVFGAELFNIANSFIVGGGADGAAAVDGTVKGVGANTDAIAASLSTKFAEAASGTTNMLSRTQGAVQNPNMELLFNGPTLRPFNFTFKLASRSETESKTIRSIIRFFKQGMSPIRTQSQLFLKAPHTFQMQYLHRGEEHKFLNQFKECALQSFSVSYTPEGQYATFQDGAMVSYQITMQFSELEPVFNDDYTNDGTGPSPNIGL
jgi:hypothetical protein